MSKISKLVLIDGNAIIHRAYHAMPKLSTPRGHAIGATQGFINILLKVIEDLKPTHIAVCWDRPEPTFRNKLFKEYQSQRPEVDVELVSQFEKVKNALSSFDIVQYDKKGYEADDLIGTLSRLAVGGKQSAVRKKKQKLNVKSQNFKSPNTTHFTLNTIDEVIIVTGDKDQLQLVNDKVKVFMPAKGLSTGLLMGEKEVKEKMGVTPQQVIDLKGFMGDPSDNYPGVYGVGPKTAQKLLEQYDTFENVYKHIGDLPENLQLKLINGKESGEISFKLAKIVTDLDIPFEEEKLREWNIGNSKTLSLFQEYGFKTLTKRVSEIRDRMNAEKQGKLF